MPDIEVVEGDGDAEEAFNRFRDRVFEAAYNSIENYSVPLIVDNGEKMVSQRSGILFQIDH